MIGSTTEPSIVAAVLTRPMRAAPYSPCVVPYRRQTLPVIRARAGAGRPPLRQEHPRAIEERRRERQRTWRKARRSSFRAGGARRAIRQPSGCRARRRGRSLRGVPASVGRARRQQAAGAKYQERRRKKAEIDASTMSVPFAALHSAESGAANVPTPRYRPNEVHAHAHHLNTGRSSSRAWSDQRRTTTPMVMHRLENGQRGN